MNQLQLDKIMQRIEGSFGTEMPFTDRPLSEADLDALKRVFGNTGFQAYLQDQVNRQIIRDYLLNAFMLGHIREERMEAVCHQIVSTEGRAALALHMLMSSVEEAGNLPLGPRRESLKKLKPGPDSKPHMEVVGK